MLTIALGMAAPGGRPAAASPCHAAARAYAAHGWAVLPVARVVDGRCSCEWPPERCTSPGKHPLAPGGCRGASTDPATIDQW